VADEKEEWKKNWRIGKKLEREKARSKMKVFI
jgi:hypothetical protein